MAAARLGEWVSMTFSDPNTGDPDAMSDMSEAESAVRIQAFLRGAQVRRELEEMRQLEEEFRGELNMATD